jgi:hypothetical protein
MATPISRSRGKQRRDLKLLPSTSRRRDGGKGDRIPGTTTVIAKLQVLILPNANML